MNQNQPWEQIVPAFPFDQAKTWKIVSSAGCGKTHTVERCIVELLDSGIRPNEIMYLIYNKLPAVEFQKRMTDRGLDKADMHWIGTHHSICLKMLGLSGKNVFNIKKWGEENGWDFSEDSFPTRILENLEKKMYEGRNDFDAMESKLFGIIAAQETDKKWTHARYMAHALSLQKLPSEVKYVFIDEAQDSVKIQWDYYEYLKSSDQIKGLMLVGDDKQSLSAWHGGRGDLFLSFKADRQVCLGKTYRNAVEILERANNIAKYIKERSPLTLESAQPKKGAILDIMTLDNCRQDILDSLKKKESVVILARCNIFAAMAKKTMEELGIPVESQTRRDVIDTFFAMKRLALKTKQTITLSDVMTVFAAEKLKTKDYCENMARFKRGEFEGAVKAEFALMEYGEPWCGDLSIFGFTPRFEADLKATLEGKLPHDIWLGASNSMILEIERSMRLYGEDHGMVKIRTIHSVKGSECDTALVLKNITNAVRQNENTEPDDEFRVWYVAATRARTKLIFTEIYQERRLVTNLV